MDFAGLATFFESSSIVVWFAVLVAIFALFVGVGLYCANRGARQKAATLLDQARVDELVSATPWHAGRPDRRAARARHPGPLSRSRRELKHSQETS